MRIYKNTGQRWLCGYWNSSPIEVGYCHYFKEVPKGEVYHSHPKLYEYYVILQGKGSLKVNNQVVSLAASQVVMIEPGERHCIVSVDSKEALVFVVIKNQSFAQNKVIHQDEVASQLVWSN